MVAHQHFRPGFSTEARLQGYDLSFQPKASASQPFILCQSCHSVFVYSSRENMQRSIKDKMDFFCISNWYVELSCNGALFRLLYSLHWSFLGAEWLSVLTWAAETLNSSGTSWGSSLGRHSWKITFLDLLHTLLLVLYRWQQCTVYHSLSIFQMTSAGLVWSILLMRSCGHQ